MAGKIGPPRKLASDTPYASPLHTSSISRAPTEYPTLFCSRGPIAACPENSTSESFPRVAAA